MTKKSTKGRLKNPRTLTHDALPASVGLVKQVRAELGAKIDSVERKLESQIQQVLVSTHRTQALMEEQRGENRIVLDGVKNVTERQDRMEGDVLEIRDSLRVLRSGPGSIA